MVRLKQSKMVRRSSVKDDDALTLEDMEFIDKFRRANGKVRRKTRRKRGKRDVVYVNVREDLSEKENRFIEEYPKHLNATRAARTARYNPANASIIGYQLLRKPRILLGLIKQFAERSKRVKIKQDDVLREIANIAFFDIRNLFDDEGYLKDIKDMSEEEGKAISSFEVEELFSKVKGNGKGKKKVHVGRIKKIKIWSKPQMIEMAAKHLGMLIDRFAGKIDVEHKHKGTLIVPGAMSQVDWQKMALEAIDKQKEQEQKLLTDDGVIDLAKLSENLYGYLTEK